MPFQVIRVSDEDGMKRVYRLRYKVYCEEWGFEDPDKFPDRLETDEYDEHAVHFAALDDNGKTVGSVRLILFSPNGFPLEKYCNMNGSGSGPRRENTAEISRLVVSRAYRKRTEDRYIYGPDEERRVIGVYDRYNNSLNNHYRRADDRYGYAGQPNGRMRNEMEIEKRHRNELVTSLYKALYHESKQRGLTHWYAVMTKGLVILLNRYGVRFQPVGEPVDYHGIRTPYLGDIKKIEREVAEGKPEIYKVFTEGL